MTTAAPQYPFDPTGRASTNLITGERQTISPPDWTDFYFIAPTATPYFASSLVMTLVATGRQLVEGVDYNPTNRFYDASEQCASPVYGTITFLDHTLSGVIELNYQTVGGPWTLNSDQIATVLANTLMDPRITTWEEVVNLPFQFPPVAHAWDIVDMVGASDVVTALNAMVTALLQSGDQGLAAHLADFNNPHRVTAAQVGLGNVQNYPLAQTADAISGSSNVLYMTPATVNTEINQFALIPLNTHIANTANPHNVTKTQVGLGNVQNYAIATTPNAQAGTDTSSYMTPALTAAAIASQAIAPLNTHLANYNNPHQVTAAQVGLGNVPNYAMATSAMAQAGTDTQSFMSPALVMAVMQTGAGGNLQAHINDHNNPHEVTAAQVGLGSVANYPIATTALAQAGTDNASYMTPQLTAAYVATVNTSFSAHLTNFSNPHDVTATQVGLGNVQNYAMAATADAQAGTLATAYMSPFLTAAAITTQALTPLNAHTANTSNPHSVTAAQIGLGSVQNLPLATTALAQAGTDNATYMTPALTAAAITTQALTPLNAHIANVANPHSVTATQVGLGSVANYPIAQSADAVAGVSTTTYMTPALTAAAVSAQALTPLNAHTGNLSNPHQVTAAQVGAATTTALTDAINGLSTVYLGINAEAANSALLGGQTLNQVIAAASSVSELTLTYPGTTAATAYSWTPLAVMTVVAAQNTAPYPAPLIFEVAGGEPSLGSSDSAGFRIVANAQDPNGVEVTRLSGNAGSVSIGTVYDATAKTLTFYLRSDGKRNPVVLRFFSDPGTSFTSSPTVYSVEPTSIVYLTQVKDTGAKAMASASHAGQVRWGLPGGSSRQSVMGDYDTVLQRINVIDASDNVSTVNNLAQNWGTYFANGIRLASYGTEAVRADKLSGWSWNTTSSAITYNRTPTGLASLLSQDSVPGALSMEILVSSSDLTDMALGIVAAYTDDFGQPAMLHVMRDCGALTAKAATFGAVPGEGAYNLFTVGYNLFQNDGLVLASSSSSLTWGDGVAAASRTDPTTYVPVTNTTISTWAATTAEVVGTQVMGNGSVWAVTTAGTTGATAPAWPASPATGATVTDGSVVWTVVATHGWINKGNVAIKVTIAGTVLTISTSDFNAAATPVYVNQLTVDLATYASHPGLASLASALSEGGVRWGVATYKQPAASFAIKAAPDSLMRYIQLGTDANGNDTSALYCYAGAAWATYTLADEVMTKPGRLYYSAVNNRLFHAFRDGTLEPIQLVSYAPAGTAILTS